MTTKEFLDEYLKLNDSILTLVQHSEVKGIEEAKKQALRIRKRDLYVLAFHFGPLTDAQEAKRIKKELEEYLNSEGMGTNKTIVTIQKYNFAMKDKNPLENVRYYSNDSPDVSFPIAPKDIDGMCFY